MSGSTNPKDANAGFLANQGTCGLLPYSGNMTSLTEWMATKGYICWNKHCFFTLYLHPNHLQIIFSKPAATLMRKENRNECMLFIATLLSHFSIKKAWAGSAETFETAEQTAGSEQLENYLKERHLIYDEAELIQSWREDILKL